MTPRRITLVTDVAADELVLDKLRHGGFDVQVESRLESVDLRLSASPPDLMVVDVADAAGGIDLIKKVRSSINLQRTPILVIAEWGTGQPTLALSVGADALERKPIDVSAILRSVERLLQSDFVRTAASAGALNGFEE